MVVVRIIVKIVLLPVRICLTMIQLVVMFVYDTLKLPEKSVKNP